MIKGACLKETNKQKRYKKNYLFYYLDHKKYLRPTSVNLKLMTSFRIFDMPIHYVTYNVESTVKSTD